MNHPGTGVPRPWQEAMLLPGAHGLTYLRDLFEGLEWWRLRPAQELVADQPGGRRFIAAAATPERDLIVVYVPEDREIQLAEPAVASDPEGAWVSPANGSTQPASHDGGRFATPGKGDWWLRLRAR